MSKLLRNGIPRKENGKIDFSWKNHYGFTGFIWLLGFIFPPLAVAIRFGIGTDFFINVPLTICGWIPGQLHNWFIQNIRNNDTKARTPRWAIRYGLVDDRPAKKLAKSRAWTGRYQDRVPQRVLYDDEGNAHVISDTVDRSNSMSEHDQIRPQKTGLVEADQWINEDGHDARSVRLTPADWTRYDDAIVEPIGVESKPARSGVTKLFSSSKRRDHSSATQPMREDDRRSSNSELSNDPYSITGGGGAYDVRSDDEDDGPEDPTRMGRREYRGTSTRSHSSDYNAPPAQHPQRRENDIFAHEF